MISGVVVFLCISAVWVRCVSDMMLPSNLSKLTLAELRPLCEERGLNYSGLIKSQILELLMAHEAKIKVLDDIKESFHASMITSTQVVTSTPQNGRGHQATVVVSDLELRKLEMQMEFEKQKLVFERKKERERLAYEIERLAFEREKLHFELEQGERLERSREIERKHEISMKELDHMNIPGKLGKYGPKIPKYQEGEDIEAYLRTFERLAHANDWPQNTWAPRLAALLTGKAREAYALMPLDEIDSYDQVKIAVLKKYQLGSEAYREKFRTSYKQPDERFQEWGTRVGQYFDRWLEINNVNTFEGLREFMIIEQLSDMLSPDLQVWVKERKPESVEKLTELAELYIMSRKKSHIFKPSFDLKSGKTQKNEISDKKKGKQTKGVTCYSCNEKGHYSNDCPNKKKEFGYKKADKPTKRAMLCLSPSRPGFINHKKFLIS